MDNQMDKPTDNRMKEHLKWMSMVLLSPIAILAFVLMALLSLLRFLCKTSLLFLIIVITTPFAVMFNVSIVVFEYNVARFRKSSAARWNWSDPRASVGVEVQLLVSDFLKVVAGELLLLLSTGIITYYTAPIRVFYISTAVWVVAIFHKWLNTECSSKTALSCLCDGYGLSPLMFLFSFVGFFDIGCHPVAKCSFAAKRAFLFVSTGFNQFNEEDGRHVHIVVPIETRMARYEESLPDKPPSAGESKREPIRSRGKPVPSMAHYEEPLPDKPLSARESNSGIEEPRTIMARYGEALPDKPPSARKSKSESNSDIEEGHKTLNAEVGRYQFNGAEINREPPLIEFLKWNAFERGLFQLSPRIKLESRIPGKYILKSSMVLRLLHDHVIWEYPVERLELPEDYSKVKELYNFLATLSLDDGFVTDKMRGRYEHSLTLSQIVQGVEENTGYRVMKPMDAMFVVAGCSE